MQQSNQLDPALAAPPARQRWYREPWMALVLGGPLLVVCASIYTAVLAYQSDDKLIASDYYKRGLRVDEDLKRDEKAALYNMRALLTMSDKDVLLKLEGGVKAPPKMELLLSVGLEGHQIEQQFKLPLRQAEIGVYRAALPLQLWQSKHVWRVKLQHDDWRLTGQWQPSRDPEVKLQAAK
ncbi:FixH family protein [Massilia sp. W12]|uniref:FixH family protein n=1 Tax=Massilia sp. W12 TaxID=3126507 RepID=UPI0030D24915